MGRGYSTTLTKRVSKTGVCIVLLIITVVIIGAVAYHEVTKPTATPTPKLYPTPSPSPTISKKEEKFAIPLRGYNTTFIVIVRLERATDDVPYPERLVWKECNHYNVTVEIQAAFNGSDKVLIKQVNAVLLNSQAEVEEGASSPIRGVVLTYNFSVSPEFEFTFHPRKGILKAEPSATFILVIEIEMYEYYQGKSARLPYVKSFEITIIS